LPWSGTVIAESARLPTDKDIIVYCASGGRSASASSYLEGIGFTRIFNMTGGFSSWSYESRAGGFGDHSGEWIKPSDTDSILIVEDATGDSSYLHIDPSVIPGSDSIYFELHYATPYWPLPPDVPVSEVNGLFRVTALDLYGIPLFSGDSLIVADTIGMKLVPALARMIGMFFDEDLSAYVPGEGWRSLDFTFEDSAFFRDEIILRRWYNAAGFGYSRVSSGVKPYLASLAVYPNPFNSSVTITVTTNNLEHAKIEIYDMNGRAVYVTGSVNSVGNLVYSGIQKKSFIWQPDERAVSGIYMVKIRMGGFDKSTKILLLK